MVNPYLKARRWSYPGVGPERLTWSRRGSSATVGRGPDRYPPLVVPARQLRAQIKSRKAGAVNSRPATNWSRNLSTRVVAGVGRSIWKTRRGRGPAG